MKLYKNLDKDREKLMRTLTEKLVFWLLFAILGFVSMTCFENTVMVGLGGMFFCVGSFFAFFAVMASLVVFTNHRYESQKNKTDSYIRIERVDEYNKKITNNLCNYMADALMTTEGRDIREE